MVCVSKAALLSSLFFVSGQGFRQQRGGSELHADRRGEVGVVDAIYSFGAPGSASPGLSNPHGPSPCFPGVRTWTAEGTPGRVLYKWMDLVVMFNNYLNYWHPRMATHEINVNPANLSKFKDCDEGDEESMYEPHGYYTPSKSLHAAVVYEAMSRRPENAWWTNITIFSVTESWIYDLERVGERVEELGWGLVGSGLHPGYKVYGGRQISHLIQDPDTLECVVTWMGTASWQGWAQNTDVRSAHFCGFVDADESCWGTRTCKTRHPRGSFVHAGMKDRVLSMVKEVSWQNNVRANLGGCAKVYSVGHSLGGSVAELFAACVARAPAPGAYGFDDYNLMSWTKAAVKKFSYTMSAGSWPEA